MKRCLSFLLLIFAALSSKAAGVQIPVDGGVLKVSFVCADIVRVQFSPTDSSRETIRAFASLIPVRMLLKVLFRRMVGKAYFLTVWKYV